MYYPNVTRPDSPKGGKVVNAFFIIFDVLDYHIYSNMHPGHVGKSFWVGAYLFKYQLQGSTWKLIILAIIRLLPSHFELGL